MIVVKCQLKVLDMLNDSVECGDRECEMCGWFIGDKVATALKLRVSKFVEVVEDRYCFNDRIEKLGVSDKDKNRVKRLLSKMRESSIDKY